MITKIDKGLVARFGCGTVRVRTEELKSGFGRLELTQIPEQAIGSKVSLETRAVAKTQKIILDFGSVESVDVVIQQLKELRSTLPGGING